MCNLVENWLIAKQLILAPESIDGLTRGPSVSERAASSKSGQSSPVMNCAEAPQRNFGSMLTLGAIWSLQVLPMAL